MGDTGERDPERRQSEKDSVPWCWFWRQWTGPWAKQCKQPLEAGKGKETLLYNLHKECSSTDTLISASVSLFWTSDLHIITGNIELSHSVVVIYHSSHRKTNTGSNTETAQMTHRESGVTQAKYNMGGKGINLILVELTFPPLPTFLVLQFKAHWWWPLLCRYNGKSSNNNNSF